MENMVKLKRLFAPSAKKGQPPGTMVYTGRERKEPPRISVIDYDDEQIRELSDVPVDECLAFRESKSVSWINIEGLTDTEMIGRIGEAFGIHPLVLEDILHTSQRPKLEDHTDYLFLVVRMLYTSVDQSEVLSEQLSFILAGNCLITFQEQAGDVFDAVRDRIRQNHGRVRKMDADYLLYALLDALVDNYFVIMETMGEQIETIEQDMMTNPDAQLLNELYRQKRELLYIRKAVWPLREAIGGLERGGSNLLQEKTNVYIKDLYDHTIQVIDAVETFRDLLAGVQDLYLSSMGHKTNQVMQVLTIIATIFIPLTFIAGIYGMNFEHMPELHWRYGYPGVWGIMVLISLGMLVFFRRKKWF